MPSSSQNITASARNVDVQIYAALVKSHFPINGGKNFAAKEALDCITPASIFKALFGSSKPSTTRDEALCKRISESAREIFAICICSGHLSERAMHNFLKHGITDDRLTEKIPFEDLNDIWPESSFNIDHFQQHQFTFRAHNFPQNDRFRERNILDHIILPITSARRLDSPGRFGTVYHVTIHKSFLDSNDPICKVCVLRKRDTKSFSKCFSHEIGAV